MQVVRWIVGAALFVALLLLSLQNSEPVTLKFYQWWSWQAPLIFIVLVTFAVGVAAGLLAGAVRSARLKGQLNRLRRARTPEIAPGPHGASPANTAKAVTAVQGGTPLDGL